jgi:serine/threonine-protein kinase
VVPNIEGKSLTEALNLVSKSGLGLRKVGESFNKDLPIGTVISQYPKVGMVVREGRYINVVISLGGEKIFVPNIVGEFRRKAELTLRQYNLFVGSVTENYSLRYQKDRIISQEPVEGTIVDKNTAVNFVVSLGIPPEDVILVPEFVNRNIEEVKFWAEKIGLTIEIKETEGTPGIVISQNPPADTLITLQDKLEIVVGKLLENKVIQSFVKEPNFFYEIPSMGNMLKNVKILQVSVDGEQILYNKPTIPGTKISLYVPPKTNSKIRIFIDGILIDEK